MVTTQSARRRVLLTYDSVGRGLPHWLGQTRCEQKPSSGIPCITYCAFKKDTLDERKKKSSSTHLTTNVDVNAISIESMWRQHCIGNVETSGSVFSRFLRTRCAIQCRRRKVCAWLGFDSVGHRRNLKDRGLTRLAGKQFEAYIDR